MFWRACAYLFTVYLFANQGHAASQPWYSVKKIDKLQIKLSFKRSSIAVNSLYFFHLNFMSRHLRADPELNLYIGKSSDSLAERRAEAIKEHMIAVLDVPEDKIFFKQVAVEPLGKNGEGFVPVVLKRHVKPIETAPVVYDNQEVESVVEETVKLPEKIKNVKLEVGLISRLSRYSETTENWGGGLDLKLNFNSDKKLQFYLQTEVVFLDGIGPDPESYFEMGLDTVYDKSHLGTYIYVKKNYTLNATTGEASDYNDIGLGQEINISLLKDKKGHYFLGGYGQFSFSNSLPDVQNASVITYGFHTKAELKKNWTVRLFFEKRKFREVQNLEESNRHIGLTLYWKY